MKHRNFPGRQQGMTLVEIMIAIAIGSFVLMAIVMMYGGAVKVYSAQNAISRMQENARFALSQMEADIRNAGSRGCAGGMNDYTYLQTTKNVNNAAAVTYANNFGFGIQGYDGSGGAWVPALDPSISGANPQPIAGNDIITIRGGSGSGIPMTGAAAIAANAPIPVASVAPFSVGQTYLITDCDGTDVFVLTGTAGNVLAHGMPQNTSASFSKGYKSEALVYPLSTVTYYIGRSANAPTGQETSLYKLDHVTGISTELVEGVQGLRLLYASDAGTISGPNYTPSNYVGFNNLPAAANPDGGSPIDSILAVKVSLLMRTVEDNVSTTKQKYAFNGVTNITPPDMRVRQVYNTTMTLRNRLP